MVVWKKCCSLLAHRYVRYLTHKFRTNSSVVGISWIVVERQVHKGFRWRHPELVSLRLETMSKIWKGNYVHVLTGTCPVVLSDLWFEPSGLHQWIHHPHPYVSSGLHILVPQNWSLALQGTLHLSQLVGWIFHPQIGPKKFGSYFISSCRWPWEGVGRFGWSTLLKTNIAPKNGGFQ